MLSKGGVAINKKNTIEIYIVSLKNPEAIVWLVCF